MSNSTVPFMMSEIKCVFLHASLLVLAIGALCLLLIGYSTEYEIRLPSGTLKVTSGFYLRPFPMIFTNTDQHTVELRFAHMLEVDEQSSRISRDSLLSNNYRDKGGYRCDLTNIARLLENDSVQQCLCDSKEFRSDFLMHFTAAMYDHDEAPLREFLSKLKHLPPLQTASQ